MVYALHLLLVLRALCTVCNRPTRRDCTLDRRRLQRQIDVVFFFFPVVFAFVFVGAQRSARSRIIASSNAPSFLPLHSLGSAVFQGGQVRVGDLLNVSKCYCSHLDTNKIICSRFNKAWLYDPENCFVTANEILLEKDVRVDMAILCHLHSHH